MTRWQRQQQGRKKTASTAGGSSNVVVASKPKADLRCAAAGDGDSSPVVRITLVPPPQAEPPLPTIVVNDTNKNAAAAAAAAIPNNKGYDHAAVASSDALVVSSQVWRPVGVAADPPFLPRPEPGNAGGAFPSRPPVTTSAASATVAEVRLYKPNNADVLCNGGVRCWEHPGNAYHRALVEHFAYQYFNQGSQQKNLKTAIIGNIIWCVRNNGGRFLYRMNIPPQKSPKLSNNGRSVAFGGGADYNIANGSWAECGMESMSLLSRHQCVALLHIDSFCFLFLPISSMQTKPVSRRRRVRSLRFSITACHRNSSGC